ncbi:cyclic nucleotide-binding domain-containing protein [Entomospira entomophila]|uniref:Cyclic nucleotide-binding domain-containing protein n=1 Tax=Entomospira entomophila TaxID=2719988 RepID=A0A968GBH0_9SPIO|nr:cyclic nucleotide-binding domain-containing protein [Entomospira entomophilus]NIZ40568.1 cyclic nucleotide-binding domain-containing protein [Entomospira entomophilus]WDI36126.1 cyclic nucleotide-binding domain-containing protein [Entomospira entomophilus]
MPKLLNFKTKSVIYFQGDRTAQFYVLRRGSVNLSNDYSKETESIEVGNFFGTQATLIGKPQGDTAMATLPSEIVAFDYQEFMTLIQSNPTLLSNMIQSFTTQLSGIHQKSQDLMNKAKDEAMSFEISLFKNASFFLKNRAYLQAKQSYEAYIQRFPKGEFVQVATEKLAYTTSKLGSPEDLSEKLYLTLSVQEEITSSQLTPMQQDYEEVLVLLNQKKYTQALVKLTKLVRMDDDPAYDSLIASCQYLLGETLLQTEKYQEAIEPLKIFTSEYSEHEEVSRAWISLAMAYDKINNLDEARNAYEMASKLTPPTDPIYNKIIQSLTNLKKKT